MFAGLKFRSELRIVGFGLTYHLPFQDLRSALDAACSAHPDRAYLVSPPMYRSSPVWYREGLPEVLTLFSQVMSGEKPKNLHLLQSFATPEFESDGVHLTAYSGLEFILHLFDSASDLLDGLALPLPDLALKGGETSRVLEDRMMAIEQDGGGEIESLHSTPYVC